MGRKRMYGEPFIASVRMDKGQFAELRDLAEAESIQTGRVVTAQSLIRQAINFVYDDNQRLRECFRRTRERTNRRFPRRY